MEQQFKKVGARRPGHYWPLLALSLLLLKPAVGEAQQVPQLDSLGRVIAPLPLSSGDTLRVRLELEPDSLVAEPMMPAAVDSARLEWLRTPPTVRDLVCDRVGCFETDVPHTFNNSVMAYVTLFTARNRAYMQRVLERENFYFPIFEKYLAQYNLPTDLKYLAVVESALIPTAKSPVGATGLWQFMGPTAGDLRLKRDEWVDERMAPEKATEAACKHLRYLYGIFHDWELVLAAYNWGAGNVQRTMRRTGKKNFWDLYPHMPAETRNYVPTFTAIMYSMKYAHSHGLHSDRLSYQYAEAMDTLGLRGQAFDLRRLSRACGYADSMYLVRFNPELRKAALPVGYRPYVVRYPAAARPHLGDVDRATLLDYCQPAAALPLPLLPRPPHLEGVEPFPTRQLLAATDGPRAEEENAAPRFRRVRHTVRRGETLAALAERFEVSQSQLRRWNELPKGRALKPGRKLVVFVPLPAAAEPAKAATEAVASASAAAPRPVRNSLTEEEAAARQALAAANAREAARIAAVAQEEKRQAARLEVLRQRQEALNRTTAAKAAAEAKAVAAAARTRQAAEEKTARLQAAADTEASVAAEAPVEAAPQTAASGKPRKHVEVAVNKTTPAADDTVPAIYIVRKGDYLTKLAREHGLSVAQLVAWNRLESETVVPGQKLVFQAPADTDAPPRKQQPKPATVVANTGKPATRSEKPAVKSHLVQPGDTLYNISRRFGVSVDELRRLNHLTTDEVKLGQKLLLPQS
jgi:membrane-bound lytic murein transglycosylase D